MNKILRLARRQASFKKIVSIVFFATFLAVFLSAGAAQASFWDWLNLNKANNDSQQSAAIANAETAKTGDAYDITSNSATIYGTINPKGENVSVYFKYRKSSESSDATKTTDWISTGGKSNDVITSIKISNLSSGTEYIYRFYAYNYTTGKTVSGDAKTFITLKGSSSSSSAQSSSSSVSSGASSSSSSKAKVQQYTLKVKISGAGKIIGTTGDTRVINCTKTKNNEYEGACRAKIDKSKSVILTVSTPSAAYKFATWADNCRAAQGLSSCTVTMSGNRTVSATFNLIKSGYVEVSVRKTGKGVGKVVSIYSAGKNSGKEDGKIKCGSNCSENYEKICEGTSEGRGCSLAYFKALPEKGSTFGGWGGDCLTFKNEKDQCYVILDGAKTITGAFNEGSDNEEGKYFKLKVNITDSNGGAVTSSNKKDINCGSGNSTCEHTYGKNGTVTLKVTPKKEYYVSKATGCSGKLNKKGFTCKVKMTENKNINVTFSSLGSSSSSSSSALTSSKYNLTVKNKGSVSGTISLRYADNNQYIYDMSGNISCIVANNGQCKFSVESSRKVKITAFANILGYKGDWSGADCSATGVADSIRNYCEITMPDSNKEIEIKFVKSSSSSSLSSSSSSSSSQATVSTYKLKVTVQGNGKIEDNYSKISCGSNMACQANYSKGQVIRIKTEDADSTGASYNTKVESWDGGGCSGTSKSCDITMDGDKEITIKFVSK